jgi:transposase
MQAQNAKESPTKPVRPPCPYCGQTAPVVRAGLNNKGGNQRHKCQRCNKYFTEQHWPKGHDQKLREQAMRMYLEGISMRAIGRILGVNHQSVANWVKQEAEALPEQVTDNTPTQTVEIDELFTFVGKKRGEST